MTRNLFIIGGALALVVGAVMLFAGSGFAQANGSDEGGYSYGESSEGAGPDLENRYGPGTGSQEEAAEVTTDDDDCLRPGPAEPQGLGHGYSHGESSEGAGPGLENHWGWPDD